MSELHYDAQLGVHIAAQSKDEVDAYLQKRGLVAIDWWDWKDLRDAKKRRDANVAYQRHRRAEVKRAEGLNPHVDRRANQRPDETDEAFAKRAERNRKQTESRLAKKAAIKNGTWQPKPKLTDIEKRQKKADYIRTWRKGKKEPAACS
jgi:hypothetical protein